MIDGIIKYSLNFTSSDAIAWGLCKDIEIIRKDLYALGLIGVYDDGIGYGNISKIVDNSKEFVITGTQTGHLSSLEAKDYAFINSVDIDTFRTVATGACKPSSETITHYALYDMSSDIRAVIHIHNKALWQYMLSSDYLATSDVEYGTIEMVHDIRRMYKDTKPLSNPIFAMRGHTDGIVAFGKSLESAKSVLYKLIREYMSR